MPPADTQPIVLRRYFSKVGSALMSCSLSKRKFKGVIDPRSTRLYPGPSPGRILLIIDRLSHLARRAIKAVLFRLGSR